MSTDLPADPVLAIESPVDPPRRQTIAGPLPCVKCLYDLNGLGENQKCPECGTEAAATVTSFAAAPVAELARLRRGLMLIALAMIAGTVWLLAGQFLILFIAFGSMGGLGSSVPMMVIMAIVPAVSLLLVVMSGLGWARITRSIATMQPERARRAGAVRRLAWTYVAFFLFSALTVIAMQMFPLEDQGMEVASVVAAPATLFIWVVRTSLGFGLLTGLAQALAARKTVRTLRVLVWCVVGLPVVIVFGAIGGEILGLESMMGVYLEYIVSGAAFLLAIVIIALGIMSFVIRARLAPFAAASVRRAAGSA